MECTPYYERVLEKLVFQHKDTTNPTIENADHIIRYIRNPLQSIKGLSNGKGETLKRDLKRLSTEANTLIKPPCAKRPHNSPH